MRRLMIISITSFFLLIALAQRGRVNSADARQLASAPVTLSWGNGWDKLTSLSSSTAFWFCAGGAADRSTPTSPQSRALTTECQYLITPAQQSLANHGGNGGFSILAAATCGWTAISTVPWITITTAPAGSGLGRINYTVTANGTANQRSGTITVGGQTHTITQAGASGSGCTVTPLSLGQTINGAVTPNDCASPVRSKDGAHPFADRYSFTASSGQPVIIALSSASFDTYLYLLNPDGSVLTQNDDSGPGASRIPAGTGFLTLPSTGLFLIEVTAFASSGIGNYTLSLTAPTNNCTYALNTTSQSFAANGGQGSVNVTTQTNCAWTTASNNSWITVAAGSSGNGPGAVNYKVAANSSASSRTGSLTMAGLNFTVTQSGTSSTNCPTVSGLNPTSGAAGSTVTLAGTNFTGVSAVKFANNLTAQFTVVSDTQLTTIVPASAVTGPLTLSKSGCPDVQTTTFTITASNCVAVAIATSLSGAPSTNLTVPITITDLSGKGVLAYDAVVTFDSTVLRLASTPVSSTGTLSSALSITTNAATPGQLRISAFGPNALSGAGTLLNLSFEVIGAAQACSNLTFTLFRLNEGVPCSTTTNGRFCVAGGGSLAGTVSYCSAAKPVPGTLLSVTGGGTAAATTNSAGSYQILNLSGGAYTLTPSKTGDSNGITSFDAALVAQHAIGAITLNECQQTAGDASNSSSLTSFDAALIAQYAIGITNAQSSAGTWEFTPPTRSYSNLAGEQANQNFQAVLVGEVSGNWTSGGALQPTPLAATLTAPSRVTQQVILALPQVTAAPGDSLTIPLTCGDLTGKGILSYDLDLVYDANVLQAQPTAFETSGTLSSTLTVTANPTPGRLRISGFGTASLSGAGTLLKLKFTVTGVAGSGTALTWQRALLNETAQSTLTNGRVNVAAAVASVSAASFLGQTLASESIVAAFGANLATTVQLATTIPLPTVLAGTTVKVRDSAGIERLAPLFFVAPTQVNYLIPASTASGAATVIVTTGSGVVSAGALQIANVAPGFFTANASGQGVAAAVAIRVRQDGSQSVEAIAQFDQALNRFVAIPLDLGPPTDQVYLILFGTGMRNVSALAAAGLTIGGTPVEVLYVGPQGDYVGLDQVNALLPRSLAGRGELNLILTVDGKPSNAAQISVK